jgi:hypothetical protein
MGSRRDGEEALDRIMIRLSRLLKGSSAVIHYIDNLAVETV